MLVVFLFWSFGGGGGGRGEAGGGGGVGAGGRGREGGGAGRVCVGAGLWELSEGRAGLGGHLDVGRRVTSRRAPGWLLIDVDHFVGLISPRDRAVLANALG